MGVAHSKLSWIRKILFDAGPASSLPPSFVLALLRSSMGAPCFCHPLDPFTSRELGNLCQVSI